MTAPAPPPGRRRRCRLLSALAVAAGLWACTPQQSALHPVGPQAAGSAGLWWLFLGICTAVWLAVMLALGLALFFRAGRRRPPDPATGPDPGSERRLTRIVAGAGVLTIVILFVLMTISFVVDKGQASLAPSDELTLRITGHRWWWEVTYDDPVPAQSFTTANEIHLPVGRTIRLVLNASDVIHSFWVPNLAGKMDLIPGRENVLRLRVDEAGTWRGECAEFCGLQHAKMALLVVAEAPAAFEAWRQGQIAPAVPPADGATRRGQEVFLAGPCIMCHTIRGTTAGATIAPDLTHVASRQMLAAGTLPNTPGYLAGWISDPQSIKYGSHMPPVPLPGADLQALLAYLESLE